MTIAMSLGIFIVLGMTLVVLCCLLVAVKEPVKHEHTHRFMKHEQPQPQQMQWIVADEPKLLEVKNEVYHG